MAIARCGHGGGCILWNVGCLYRNFTELKQRPRQKSGRSTCSAHAMDSPNQLLVPSILPVFLRKDSSLLAQAWSGPGSGVFDFLGNREPGHLIHALYGLHMRCTRHRPGDEGCRWLGILRFTELVNSGVEETSLLALKRSGQHPQSAACH